MLVAVSETSMKSNAGLGMNFSGITYDATIAYQVTSRLLVNIEIDQQTNPSNRLDTTYTIDKIYKAELDYKLSSAFSLKLGASDTHQAFVGAALVPLTDLTRDNQKSFFLDFQYTVTPRLSINLTANQDQTNADLGIYSYTSSRIGLAISQAL